MTQSGTGLFIRTGVSIGQDEDSDGPEGDTFVATMLSSSPALLYTLVLMQSKVTLCSSDANLILSKVGIFGDNAHALHISTARA